MNILISGALGKMGKKVRELIEAENLTAVGVDIKSEVKDGFKVYDSFSKVKEKIDVVIDFSSAKNLDNVLEFASSKNCGAVLCTTGYTEEDLKKIKEYSKTVPLFRSANMSLGVNVLLSLVKKAVQNLNGFDVEIIEKHHNEKVDAPSGTAIMIADKVKEVCPDYYTVNGRSGQVGKRNKKEIGIHAVRGGNIVGEHEIIFAGTNETLTISHQATDRGVFAAGAIKAAKYICSKKHGLFDMEDMLNGK